jgi:hypothetical protein
VSLSDRVGAGFSRLQAVETQKDFRSSTKSCEPPFPPLPRARLLFQRLFASWQTVHLFFFCVSFPGHTHLSSFLSHRRRPTQRYWTEQRLLESYIPPAESAAARSHGNNCGHFSRPPPAGPRKTTTTSVSATDCHTRCTIKRQLFPNRLSPTFRAPHRLLIV